MGFCMHIRLRVRTILPPGLYRPAKTGVQSSQLQTVAPALALPVSSIVSAVSVPPSLLFMQATWILLRRLYVSSPLSSPSPIKKAFLLFLFMNTAMIC